jgi:hypothetical protein
LPTPREADGRGIDFDRRADLAAVVDCQHRVRKIYRAADRVDPFVPQVRRCVRRPAKSRWIEINDSKSTA